MNVTSVLLLTHLLFIFFAEARLWNKTKKRSSDDGGAPTQRIWGGDEAREGRFSYAVSFQSGYSTSGHFCGGSLIARDMVLSAAHCADGSSSPRYDAVINRHDHDEYWIGDRVDAVKEYIHPDYRENTNEFDVMVVQLARLTDEDVSPVEINSSSSTPSSSSSVYVVGWGVTETGYTSDELKEVEVKVVSQTSCKSSYGDSIKDSMLCAADRDEDSCQGDSGGPLFLKGNSEESDLQVGIVSWGYGCAESSFPGVYSRVSSSYYWIRDQVCGHSRDEDARSRFGCPTSDALDDGFIDGDDIDSSVTVNDTDDFKFADDDNMGYYYYDDFYVFNDDDWWGSWQETVSDWWQSWWN